MDFSILLLISSLLAVLKDFRFLGTECSNLTFHHREYNMPCSLYPWATRGAFIEYILLFKKIYCLQKQNQQAVTRQRVDGTLSKVEAAQHVVVKQIHDD